MTESDLIQTGIYGLDQIFLGGILKGNLILVEGAAGVGKTLLGIEFIYRGITEHDEPGIIVVFETSPRDRKSTRLNSSHVAISYAVFCLKKKIVIWLALILDANVVRH